MAEEQGPENLEGTQTQPITAPKSVDLNVGGSVEGNLVVGDHNYIVNNYYPAIEKNTEKHEPDYWALKHLYPMPPNFTGRIAERALLTHWLKENTENRLFILRALGGFGKSALAWQWLTHDVDIKEYPKVVFWSFYEGDASFEHFIEETLKYLKLEVPQGQRPQVDELLKAMQSQKILLIMDGFERALRAYSSMNAAYQGDEESASPDSGRGDRGEGLDCVNINAEIFLKSICSLPNIKSKVLMTTRLTPRAIKPRGEFMLGCREVELTAMQKEDAVAFFRRQGIKGTHAEIEATCAPYGYHPLSLRLLAGRILKDFENPADITVARKLKIDGDIIQQKHHVLEVSYNSLSHHEQKLLSTIACFRSPVELKALQSITENKNSLNNDLHDLVERDLLHFNEKSKKFDLHPIVRRYAYDRLTTSERTNAHERLVDYFEAIPKPEKIERLEDLAPVIELYHHMINAGNYDEALLLFYQRLWESIYYHLGAYYIQITLLNALFLGDEAELPGLTREDLRGWVLGELANAYSAIGQPRYALSLCEESITISRKLNHKLNAAVSLGNVAIEQLSIGILRAAESNLKHRIDLCQEIQDEFNEAVAHQELGRLFAYLGAWKKAEQELLIALELAQKQDHPIVESLTWSYRSLIALLKKRENKSQKIVGKFLERALDKANEWSNITFPMEREFVRIGWLTGATYRLNNRFDFAEGYLNEALTRDRAINLVEFEADILLDLARLRYDQKKFEEAKNLADEALLITERCGYVLQGADVNLFLAQYALEQEKDNAKAKQYAKEALKLAYCDGPPYYYKVAYEEAERFLENLK